MVVAVADLGDVGGGDGVGSGSGDAVLTVVVQHTGSYLVSTGAQTQSLAYPVVTGGGPWDHPKIKYKYIKYVLSTR